MVFLVVKAGLGNGFSVVSPALSSLCDVRCPPRSYKCRFVHSNCSASFLCSMSHLLALQSLCGRIHPSARKMLKVSYWRAAEVSTHVLPLLGV